MLWNIYRFEILNCHLYWKLITSESDIDAAELLPLLKSTALELFRW